LVKQSAVAMRRRFNRLEVMGQFVFMEAQYVQLPLDPMG